MYRAPTTGVKRLAASLHQPTPMLLLVSMALLCAGASAQTYSGAHGIYKYVGCYRDVAPQDDSYDRAMMWLANGDKSVGSVSDCQAKAVAAGFRYFSLQSEGRQCFGSNNLAQVSKFGRSKDCGPACLPRWTNCSASWANSVYETVITRNTLKGGTFVYKGCYADKGRDRRTNITDTDYVRNMHFITLQPTSAGECAQLAAVEGFRYFALQFGGQCMGSNSWYAVTQNGPSDQCDSQCDVGGYSYDDGDYIEQRCGGAFANSVFEITK